MAITPSSPPDSHANLSPAWYQYRADETLARLHSRETGLTALEAENRLARYGRNSLPAAPRKPAWLRFLLHFNDVLIYILLAAAVVTGVMGHWVDTAVILAVAVINTLIGYLQESSAERSLQGIRAMLSSRARVMRQGRVQAIEADELVPGDIVQLRPGDKVPADLRLIAAHNLRADEAILTGESITAEKTCTPIQGERGIGDRSNMLFSGTMVSAGSAAGVVVATGQATELGRINQMMGEAKAQRTPLLQQMDRLGKGILGLILLMMAFLFLFAFILRDMPLGELLLALISLAVASVPEGLPAIISIILSLGVQAMARNHAIIRKLPTVETLGAMTVVCSDKTGTLTRNEMTVNAVILADSQWRVSGDSYAPQGEIVHETSGRPASLTQDTALSAFLTAAHLCNDSQLAQDPAGDWSITGGPTEGAMKVLAAKAGVTHATARLVDKIPFDSAYKYMATHHQLGDEHRIFLTGAPDVLFSLCEYQLTDAGVVPFEREFWAREMARYARQGLRMLAAASKPATPDAAPLDHADLHQGMVFLGIAGMMDPPRPEAVDAIATCRQAGIRVKMITGDHPETAMAIGAMLGIGDGTTAITGAELETMSDEALAGAAQRYDIFARTSPAHKLRLVRALQQRGEVVGMTGDGVNDAPALKQADVGIAMGIKGTEVTQEAADMVLTDDNFATLAQAVKAGRRVYDNLRKTILFIMPTNLAQGLLIVIAILAGALIPLTPIQILWMNMATSVTLSFGLAFEPAEPDLMQRRPRDPRRHVIDLHGIWRIGFVGTLIACAAFLLEAWLQPRGYAPEFIRTVLLQMLVTAQWAYMLNCRTLQGFALNRKVFANRALWVVSGILLLLQLAILYLPFMNTLFGTVPLPPTWWGVTLLAGVGIFLIVELEKWLLGRIKKPVSPAAEPTGDRS
ncbi:cation-transporting P-type ATPase [Nissabacter archeti]|uniref:Cation-transporting P-type ATPase n=1 Tax=Nissabacter archeti TaxID=1917880 RepID=A0ABS5JFQ1_9GAMM|nr:cation-transporting P-type ATPase [Nissabacter archeti]MBS0968780.1 cation-transporting P-type ATPase [Nissabacter archeti]